MSSRWLVACVLVCGSVLPVTATEHTQSTERPEQPPAKEPPQLKDSQHKEPPKEAPPSADPKKKTEEKKTEDKKVEDKKAEDKKAEDKKADDKKADDKKAEDKKAEDKKAEDKKAEDKKAEDKKAEGKKAEAESKPDQKPAPEDKKPEEPPKSEDPGARKPVTSPNLAIKLAFMAEPALFPLEIEVEMDGQKAVLRGAVPTEEEKAKAAEAAKTVEGVESVVNKLTVNTAVHAAWVKKQDEAITQLVKERLQRSETLKSVGFDVKAENGVVSLSGKTRYQVIALEAAEAARHVPGVRAVMTTGVQLIGKD
jgi:hypothetical protein